MVNTKLLKQAIHKKEKEATVWDIQIAAIRTATEHLHSAQEARRAEIFARKERRRAKKNVGSTGLCAPKVSKNLMIKTDISKDKPF